MKKIKQILKNKKTKKFTLIVLIVIMAVFVLPQLTFAQDITGDIEKVYKEMITFLVAIMQFLQKLIWPVLLMIGGLLKNDILFSAGMEETMLVIWSNIRNIVNILFVLVLLGIAFYNVMGGGSDEFKLKTILPKFVIALIAVNFSFLGVKVVVDATSVITTALFALPGAVERELKTDVNFEKQFCEGIYGKTDYKDNTDKVKDEDLWCGKKGTAQYVRFTQKAKNFFASYDSHNAAIVLAINMAEIGKLDTVKVGTESASLSKLTINILFSIVFYIIYTIAFVVLLIVLLVRLVVLWVTMVMSPLIVLTFVLPESIKSSLGSANDLGKQFIQNAIAPIPIALVMSIGFIMLQSLKQAQFSNVSINTTTLHINMLTSGLSTLQDVIAAVAMVIVIWMGVFAATKGTFAEGITNKIKDVTEGFGKFLATAPIKYAPIIPVYTGKDGEPPEKVSLAGAMGALQNIPRGFEDKSQKEASRVAELMGAMGASGDIDSVKGAKDAKGFMQTLINASPSSWGNAAFQKAVADQLRNNKSWKLNFGNLKDKEGKAIKEADFIKQLAEGKADEKNVEQFIRENRKDGRFSNMTPDKKDDKAKDNKDAAEKGGKAGAAAGAAAAIAINGAEADSRITAQDATQRAHALNADQQQKIEAYRKDAEKLPEAQEALKALTEEKDAAHQFQEQLSEALPLEGEAKTAAVDTLIRQHEQGLIERMKKRDSNLTDDEAKKRAAAIIQKDLDDSGIKNASTLGNSKEYTRIQSEKNNALYTPPPKPTRGTPAAKLGGGGGNTAKPKPPAGNGTTNYGTGKGPDGSTWQWQDKPLKSGQGWHWEFLNK